MSFSQSCYWSAKQLLASFEAWLLFAAVALHCRAPCAAVSAATPETKMSIRNYECNIMLTIRITSSPSRHFIPVQESAQCFILNLSNFILNMKKRPIFLRICPKNNFWWDLEERELLIPEVRASCFYDKRFYWHEV